MTLPSNTIDVLQNLTKMAPSALLDNVGIQKIG